jgi:cytochrome c-type biogenesis protein CcmH
MMLWPILMVMTLGAIAAVCWPLTRREKSFRSGSDLLVYRDQLDEIRRDEAASLIGKAESEAARVEVSRRLIAAAQATATKSTPGSATWYRRATLAAALLLLPLGAGATYLRLGSPNLEPVAINAGPGAPPLPSSMEQTVVEVEAQLARDPTDGRGWEMLAPIYLRQGRFDDAVTARRNALRIFGPDAARLGDLGEAMVMAADGVVTAEAKSLFERAAADDPEDVMAQYYLGLTAKQDGHRDEAEKRWRSLLARAEEGAEWVPMVKNALARIDEKTPAVADASPQPGDDAIEAMVERLAERLQQDGSDVAGWVKLVRSYRVLGMAEKVEAATAEAHTALASDPESLKRLDQGLQALERESDAMVPDGPAPTAPGPAAKAGEK